MKIISNLLTLGGTNRKGKKMKKVLGVIIHYIGVGQTKAVVIRNNFEKGGRVAATHYVVDYNDGSIQYCVPEDEFAPHVGAKKYTELKTRLCGTTNPNYHFIGIECCIKSIENSKPSDVEYNALIELVRDICKRHNLSKEQILLHFDITGKICHKYYVENPNEWEKFREDVFRQESPIAQVTSEWAKDAQEFVKINNISDATNPKSYATREQVWVMLHHLYNLFKGEENKIE